jgi:hypothetical protein
MGMAALGRMDAPEEIPMAFKNIVALGIVGGVALSFVLFMVL